MRLGAFVLAIGLAGVAASPRARPEAAPVSIPRLVLLYAPCTLNRGFLSPYDSGVDYTPELARFARDAVVFERHFTEAGQSGIAYASLLSGSQADHHGVYRHPRRLSDDLYLISEAYADNGYDTYFWNGQAMAAPRLNYGQGVPREHTVDSQPRGRQTGAVSWRRRARQLYRDSGLAEWLRPIREWLDMEAASRRIGPRTFLSADDPRFAELLDGLRADASRRAFVLTNFTYTHGPYETEDLHAFLERYPSHRPPLTDEKLDAYVRLYRRNHLAVSYNFEETLASLGISEQQAPEFVSAIEVLYASNVWALDRLFGAVVAKVREAGLLDESLIVFAADHGEVLYREDALYEFTHGMQLAPEVLEVPLLIRSSDPAVKPGAYEAVTRSIDVFPTMLGLSGLELPADSGVQGTDLSPALRGLAPAPELPAFSHTSILVRSIFNSTQDEELGRDFRILQRYFPDDHVRWIWVSLAERSRFYRLRRSSNDAWSVEAFDLDRDPTASRDLFDPEDPEQIEIARRLAAYKTRLEADYAAGRDAEEKGFLPQQEEEEALRELGYIR